MKITQKQLKQLIKEEISKLLTEQLAGAATVAPGRAGADAPGTEANPPRATAPAPAPGVAIPTTSGGGMDTNRLGTQRFTTVTQTVNQFRTTVQPTIETISSKFGRIRRLINQNTVETYNSSPDLQRQVSALLNEALASITTFKNNANTQLNSVRSIINAGAASVARGLRAPTEDDRTLSAGRIITLNAEQNRTLNGYVQQLGQLVMEADGVIQTIGLMRRSMADGATIVRTINSPRRGISFIRGAGGRGELAIPVAEPAAGPGYVRSPDRLPATVRRR